MMREVKWRQQYVEPERDDALDRISSVTFEGVEDLAVQSYKDDADINVLVRRFGVTGEMPRASVEPFYGDFSEVVDYQTAMNRLREADSAFASLPSAVRRRFADNPAELIGFLQDPDNRAEAEQLGLVPKAPPVEPKPVVEDGSGA